MQTFSKSEWRIVISALSGVLVGCLLAASAMAESPTFRFIAGGGGAPIAMMEWGDPTGPGILFLHGAGFASEFWLPQTTDPVLGKFHMVAIDLRGHGASGKPWKPADLVDSRLWAEDVAAAIAAAKLRQPLLVGWSYGGFVAMDYVRHFGTADIAGLLLVASPAGLVPRLHPDPPAGYEEAARQRYSLSTEDNRRGSRYMAELMTAADLPEAVLEQWTAQMLRLPVYVSQGLQQGRSLDNADLTDALNLPVAIAVGGMDKSMPFDKLKELATNLPEGEYWVFPAAGHAVSTDVAADFNQRLRKFAEQVASQ